MQRRNRGNGPSIRIFSEKRRVIGSVVEHGNRYPLGRSIPFDPNRISSATLDEPWQVVAPVVAEHHRFGDTVVEDRSVTRSTRTGSLVVPPPALLGGDPDVEDR